MLRDLDGRLCSFERPVNEPDSMVVMALEKMLIEGGEEK